jgi:hypothetical protein
LSTEGEILRTSRENPRISQDFPRNFLISSKNIAGRRAVHAVRVFPSVGLFGKKRTNISTKGKTTFPRYQEANEGWALDGWRTKATLVT